ncbi:MAG: hypothetical protein ABIF71_05300 [Planctomycetota bacterium]
MSNEKKGQTMRRVLICLTAGLALGAAGHAQQPGPAPAAGETVFETYRVWGRDPMVSQIVRKQENPDAGVGTLVLPGDPGDTEGDPLALTFKKRLNANFAEARKMIGQRQFAKVIMYCEEGLKIITEIQAQTGGVVMVPPRELETKRQEFERWKRAALEGIIQMEALEDFQKRQIKLQGIIWDEVDPIAILDGTGLRQGEPYRGVQVEKIENGRVNVIFKYKQREFTFTLEITEE